MMQLPPWLQLAGTIALSVLTIALTVLVSLPRLGRRMREQARELLSADPRDEEGLRLLARGNKFLRLGSDLRALRDSPVGQALPAPMRLLLESLPESDPPPPEFDEEKTK